MTYSGKPDKVEHSKLEDNIYWQKRQMLCYFAKLDGRSAEDESLGWLSSWQWYDDINPVESHSNAETLIKAVAMLHQWLIVLSTTPREVRSKWADEYASTTGR